MQADMAQYLLKAGVDQLQYIGFQSSAAQNLVSNAEPKRPLTSIAAVNDLTRTQFWLSTRDHGIKHLNQRQSQTNQKQKSEQPQTRRKAPQKGRELTELSLYSGKHKCWTERFIYSSQTTTKKEYLISNPITDTSS